MSNEKMLSLETFSENNRSKVIGDSLYKICFNPKTKTWYIFETVSTKNRFIGAKGCFNQSLRKVIGYFNKIKYQREIIKKE